MKTDKTKSSFEETVISALAQLQGDVSSIKTDINGLKTDVGGLKADVSDLKSDVSDLKSDVRRLEVLHEETDSKIDHILEVLIPNTNEITEIRDHEAEQDETILFHERRISLLEKKVA